MCLMDSCTKNSIPRVCLVQLWIPGNLIPAVSCEKAVVC
jgi:hypothetical protein